MGKILIEIEIEKEELKTLIENAIEEKLIELFGDPDEGLKIKDTFRKRLLKQREKVIAGERRLSLEKVTKDLGFESF